MQVNCQLANYPHYTHYTHPGPGVSGEAVGPLGWHVGRIAPLSVPRGISYVCASVELKYTTQQTVPRKRGSQFWDQDMQELDWSNCMTRKITNLWRDAQSIGRRIPWAHDIRREPCGERSSHGRARSPARNLNIWKDGGSISSETFVPLVFMNIL